MMTPQEASRITRSLCQKAPVIPVLVIEDANRAAALAQALVAGGLTVLEVTLRSTAALEAIRAMTRVPGCIVGAGTVLNARDAEAAQAAGAEFAVSPGTTPDLLAACERLGLPLLPGAATATEAMALLERGYAVLKFFPAEAAGGADALKALGGPLPRLSFCPTGGITPDNAARYLSLPNCLCVGGSWVAPAEAVAGADWARITRLARDAAGLG